MNAKRKNQRELLFGAVFLAMGLLQFILYVIRAEPLMVNLVLSVIFSAGGLWFSVSAFLHGKKSELK